MTKTSGGIHKVHGVLQAGGAGIRLLPLTENKPKPLIEVAGVPMVERLLRQFLLAGVRDISVILGPLGNQIKRQLESLKDLPSDLQLHFITEDRPLGNIGALKLVQHDGAAVLVSFADIVTNLDFSELVKRYYDVSADVLLTSHYEYHQVHLGELLVNDSQVTGYLEKPKKQFLICSGIGIFNPEVFDLIMSDSVTGISDLIVSAIEHYKRVDHWVHGAFWMDINTPDALEKANRELRSG